MIALITTVLAGTLIFLRSGFLVGAASVICAYAAFIAYAYFRSRMWMKDPAVEAAIAEGRQPPRAIRIERIVAAIVVPLVFAYIPYALLS